YLFIPEAKETLRRCLRLRFVLLLVLGRNNPGSKCRIPHIPIPIPTPVPVPVPTRILSQPMRYATNTIQSQPSFISHPVNSFYGLNLSLPSRIEVVPKCPLTEFSSCESDSRAPLSHSSAHPPGSSPSFPRATPAALIEAPCDWQPLVLAAALPSNSHQRF